MESEKARLNIILGNNLRNLRKELGKTQERFAEELNICTSFYANMERGCKMPSVETLCRIAHRLNISIDSLLNNDIVENNIENIIALLKSQPESVILKHEKILRIIIEDNSSNDNGNTVD